MRVCGVCHIHIYIQKRPFPSVKPSMDFVPSIIDTYMYIVQSHVCVCVCATYNGKPSMDFVPSIMTHTLYRATCVCVCVPHIMVNHLWTLFLLSLTHTYTCTCTRTATCSFEFYCNIHIRIHVHNYIICTCI